MVRSLVTAVLPLRRRRRSHLARSRLMVVRHRPLRRRLGLVVSRVSLRARVRVLLGDSRSRRRSLLRTRRLLRPLRSRSERRSPLKLRRQVLPIPTPSRSARLNSPNKKRTGLRHLVSPLVHNPSRRPDRRLQGSRSELRKMVRPISLRDPLRQASVVDLGRRRPMGPLTPRRSHSGRLRSLRLRYPEPTHSDSPLHLRVLRLVNLLGSLSMERPPTVRRPRQVADSRSERVSLQRLLPPLEPGSRLEVGR